MRIYTNKDIRKIEELALEEREITRAQMIEEVAISAAAEIDDYIEDGQSIITFAGPELCGAYALETSRLLALEGRDVTVYLLNVGGNRLNAECSEMRQRFLDEVGESSLVEFIDHQITLPELNDSTPILDGLFGIEHVGPLSGGYQTLVRIINESGANIISIDVPSGLSGDSRSGLINRNIIHADLTLTIGMPKLDFFMRENAELIGTWKVLPFDYGHKAFQTIKANFAVIEKGFIRDLLVPRDPFASKADFGNAIIFAGSYGMMGAAVLAARGALRSGCGKVTVHSPRCGFFILQSAVPSALYETDQESDGILKSISIDKSFNAVAIGPGIGTADATIKALESYLKLASANSRPTILDADALNCIALRPTMLSHIPVGSVLTPHVGEFERLFGACPTSEARLHKAIETAQYYKVIIVLKGRYTAVIRPDGKVCFNSTGTPALATGGTGDVLTGVIAGLMAQGIPAESAAIAGVYIHGLAGSIAEKQEGTYGVIAEDVANAIGQAIKRIMK
jgi:NAD(P)H-hydrate epimerase